MMFRIIFWDILPCKMIVDRRFRGAYCLHHQDESLTYRLRVFENRVLRRIFGPKRDEVTGEWRKFQNKELHNLYSSPDIIRQVKSCQGE
jgi:hypothetical protein